MAVYTLAAPSICALSAVRVDGPLRLVAGAAAQAGEISLRIVHHDVTDEVHDFRLVVSVGAVGRDVAAFARHDDFRGREIAGLEVGIDGAACTVQTPTSNDVPPRAPSGAVRRTRRFRTRRTRGAG